MEERSRTNRKRRERAMKMRAEITESEKAASEDSCDEDFPLVRPKPPRPRKKNKEPLYEEDIIDGFAVLAFKSYEDLERCVRAAEKVGSRTLDPCPDRLKSDTVKRKLLIQSKLSNKGGVGGGSHSSSEEGYICDGESEDDRASDSVSDLFTTVSKGTPCWAVSAGDDLLKTNPRSPLPLIKSLGNGPLDLYYSNNVSSSLPIVRPNPLIDIKPPIYSIHPPPLPVRASSEATQQKSSIPPDPIDSVCVTCCPVTVPTSTATVTSVTCTTTLSQSFTPNFKTVCSSAVNGPITGSCGLTTNSALKYSVSALVSPVTVSSSKPTLPIVSQNHLCKSVPQVTTGATVLPPVSCTSVPVNVVSTSDNATSVVNSQTGLPHSVPPYHVLHSKSQPPPVSSASSAVCSIPISVSLQTNSAPVPTYTTCSSIYPSSTHPPSLSTVTSRGISSSPAAPLQHAIKVEPPDIRPSSTSSSSSQKVPLSAPLNAGVSPGLVTNIKTEPGSSYALPHHSQLPSLLAKASTPSHVSGLPSGPCPRSHDSGLYGPVSSSAATVHSTRLTPLNRPGLPLSFSHQLVQPPISAHLPPSGMFAPHIPVSQSLSSTSILPPPPHLAPGDPLAQADLLRRELDSRFLATQDRSLGLAGPAFSSLSAPPAFVRAEMHHHQHQHTHVHQHLLPHMAPPLGPPAAASSGLFSHSATPSLFKEVNKVGLDSGLYQPGSALNSTYQPTLSSLVAPPNTTPFVPPAHLSSGASKVRRIYQNEEERGEKRMFLSQQKSGYWNAMHVRIAWEIYYHQQKQSAEKSSTKIGADMLRGSSGIPGSGLFPLPRPPELGPTLLGAGVPPHYDPTLMGPSHMMPSLPGLSGLRYPGSSPASASHSSFSHPGITPTAIPGPPPGSMFSRDPIPSGLTLPTPTPHGSWRLQAPTPFSSSSSTPWPLKPSATLFERERREQEERDRREREERERREREERERREREERLREREERERKEREEREQREREERQRERERERRAEQEKERAARSLEASQERTVRRENSRSPMRRDVKDPSLIHSVVPPSHIGAPPPSLGMSSMKSDIRTDSRPASGSGIRPGSRPVKMDTKDDVVIVGGKEGIPRQPHIAPPHSSMLHNPTGSLLSMGPIPPPSSLAASVIERERMLISSGQYSGAPLAPSPWLDPFRDPYRSPEFFQSQFLMPRDPIRESLDRAAREELMRANPLGNLILSERYREQHAREMQERERMAAVAAGVIPGLYSQGMHMFPPSHISSHLLPPTMKPTSPMGHGPHLPGAPGLHPPMGSIHSTLPGAGHPPPLAPGLPPPLVPSLPGASPAGLPRPLDKKDDPR